MIPGAKVTVRFSFVRLPYFSARVKIRVPGRFWRLRFNVSYIEGNVAYGVCAASDSAMRFKSRNHLTSWAIGGWLVPLVIEQAEQHLPDRIEWVDLLAEGQSPGPKQDAL